MRWSQPPFCRRQRRAPVGPSNARRDRATRSDRAHGSGNARHLGAIRPRRFESDAPEPVFQDGSRARDRLVPTHRPEWEQRSKWPGSNPPVPSDRMPDLPAHHLCAVSSPGQDRPRETRSAHPDATPEKCAAHCRCPSRIGRTGHRQHHALTGSPREDGIEGFQ